MALFHLTAAETERRRGRAEQLAAAKASRVPAPAAAADPTRRP